MSEFIFSVINDDYKYNDIETQARKYLPAIRLMLNSTHRDNLINNKTYLRIFCQQDEEDSESYMNVYIRSIDKINEDLYHMLEPHNSEFSKNYILCEINFQRGHFFYVNSTYFMEPFNDFLEIIGVD